MQYLYVYKYRIKLCLKHGILGRFGRGAAPEEETRQHCGGRAGQQRQIDRRPLLETGPARTRRGRQRRAHGRLPRRKHPV